MMYGIWTVELSCRKRLLNQPNHCEWDQMLEQKLAQILQQLPKK